MHTYSQNRGPVLAGRIQCLLVTLLPSPGFPLYLPYLQALLWAVLKHHILALLPVLANVAEMQCEDRENSLQVLQETANTISRKRL